MLSGTITDNGWVKINDKLYTVKTHGYEIGDTVSIINPIVGNMVIAEKFTEQMIDDVVIKEKLSITCKIPVSGTISSLFGPRRNPCGLYEEFHNGIDIAADMGEEVYAVCNGIVTDIEHDHKLYGNMVIVDLDGFKVCYAHLNDIVVMKDDVNPTLIGYVGSTGKSSGPHLHIGMTYYNKDLNPKIFFKRGTMQLGRKVFCGEQ